MTLEEMNIRKDIKDILVAYKNGEIKLNTATDTIQALVKSSNSDYSVTPSVSPKFPEYDYVRDMFPNVDTVLFSTIYHAIKYSGNFT